MLLTTFLVTVISPSVLIPVPHDVAQNRTPIARPVTDGAISFTPDLVNCHWVGSVTRLRRSSLRHPRTAGRVSRQDGGDGESSAVNEAGLPYIVNLDIVFVILAGANVMVAIVANLAASLGANLVTTPNIISHIIHIGGAVVVAVAGEVGAGVGVGIGSGSEIGVTAAVGVASVIPTVPTVPSFAGGCGVQDDGIARSVIGHIVGKTAAGRGRVLVAQIGRV